MSIRAFFIGGAYYMAVESGLVGSVALLLGGPVEHQLFNFSFLNKYCPEVFHRSLVVEGVVDLYFNLVEPDLAGRHFFCNELVDFLYLHVIKCNLLNPDGPQQ